MRATLLGLSAHICLARAAVPRGSARMHAAQPRFYSKGAAWIDGRVLPLSEAKLGVTDWGLIHADCVYDVVPAVEGAFFRLPDYIERFQASMAAGQYQIDQSAEEIRAIMHSVVAASGLTDAYCAMVCARGTPRVAGSRDPRDCASHFFAWAVPYVRIFSPEVVSRGAKIQIARGVRRIPESSVDSRAKNYHWGDFTAGLLEAKAAGYDSTLLLDHAGHVAEGPGFNVFAVSGARVVTPSEHVLEGITRRTAMELCEAAGLDIEVRPLPEAELLDADEVFVTSSAGGVFPIASIDGHVYGVGPVATKLEAGYWALTKDPAWRDEISYCEPPVSEARVARIRAAVSSASESQLAELESLLGIDDGGRCSE
jgi:branched-chain amino acid aminotransferase